jgi:hypothetical protein
MIGKQTSKPALSKLAHAIGLSMYQARSGELVRAMMAGLRVTAKKVKSAEEIRYMLDRKLGDRTLTEELYKMREAE